MTMSTMSETCSSIKVPLSDSKKTIQASTTKNLFNTNTVQPAEIIQRARLAPHSLNYDDVMQLQKTIGNKAVMQLLSELKYKNKDNKFPMQLKTHSQPMGKNETGMPDSLKAGLETLSNIDLSDVRVNYNSDLPKKVGALAYTQGNSIHIASGQEKQLPHEGWHAVQQKQGRVNPTVQLKTGIRINDDAELEKEADIMGDTAASNKTVTSPYLQKAFIQNGKSILQKKDSASEQTDTYDENDKKFIEDVKKFLDARIEHYNNLIEKKKREYTKKKWGGVEKDSLIKTYINNIKTLNSTKTDFTKFIGEYKAIGHNVLLLANVVYNEAANYSDKSKLAIAYAYMNRKGNVTEPAGNEISHYIGLNDRFNNYSPENKELFIKNFIESMKASYKRLTDKDPKETDKTLTKGATHWLSPKGLEKDRWKGDNNYRAEFKKYFPAWATSERNPKYHNKDFKEIIVDGIDKEEFLFYKGVKY